MTWYLFMPYSKKKKEKKYIILYATFSLFIFHVSFSQYLFMTLPLASCHVINLKRNIPISSLYLNKRVKGKSRVLMRHHSSHHICGAFDKEGNIVISFAGNGTHVLLGKNKNMLQKTFYLRPKTSSHGNETDLDLQKLNIGVEQGTFCRALFSYKSIFKVHAWITSRSLQRYCLALERCKIYNECNNPLVLPQKLCTYMPSSLMVIEHIIFQIGRRKWQVNKV
jgi:hypothetical protein